MWKYPSILSSLYQFVGIPAFKETNNNGENNPDKSEQPQRILWDNVIIMALLHYAAIHSFITHAIYMKIFTVLWTVMLGMLAILGVTAGLHRLWSHGSYKAKAPLKCILLVGYTIAAEFSPWDWVRYHRIHHKFSDRDADPHNASRGLFYSHFGWLMQTKHPETVKQEALVDMSDINGDKIFMFFAKYYGYLGTIFGFVIPTVVPVLFWNETLPCSISAQLVRYIVVINIVASINSFSHKYGYKPYKKDILPTESTLRSIITLGEGSHNYHHAFPWDYRSGEIGYLSCNLTTRLIQLCSHIGWVYDMKVTSTQLVDITSKKHGDGSRKVSSKVTD